MMYTNEQLALKLAVEAYGDRSHTSMFAVEFLANQFLKYLETGKMT